MPTEVTQAEVSTNKKRHHSMGAQVLGRLLKNKTAMFCLIVLILMMVLSYCAPFFAPYSPTDVDLLNINAKISKEHLLGTDEFGRDSFTRLLYGGRYSLSLGFVGAAIALVVGISLGTIAGFFGGITDTIIMRILDIIQAIPGMLFAIIISTVLGGGFVNTCIALSLTSVPTICRILRAQIMSIRKEEYLEAAESIGCSKVRIMWKHTLPNVLSPVIVNAAMTVGATISQAAGLSYIGLGIQPPTPEWGAMLSAGRNYVRTDPKLVLCPGICIGLTVLCINVFGDGLRDAMDPKLKR